MESEKGIEKNGGSDDVVVSIAGIEETSKTDSKAGGSSTFSDDTRKASTNVEPTELEKIKPKTQISSEITKASGVVTVNRPPKILEETVIDRPLLTRSAHSKPKSRLVELPPPNPGNRRSVEERGKFLHSRASPYTTSPPCKSNEGAPKGNERIASITMKTPLMATQGENNDDVDDDDDEDDEDDEDVYRNEQLKVKKKSGKRWKFFMLLELIVFGTLITVLIASLTVKCIQHHTIWGLETWKWLVLLLVIFCGRLFSDWFIDIIVFLIERNFLLKKKVLYFVHGLKKSVHVFLWLVLVLVAWVLLINRGVQRSQETSRVLSYVTRALISSLIGAAMWMAKTLLVKIVASTFHVKRFFDRIQDSIFYQYVLLTLSGPPSIHYAETIGKTRRLLSLSHMKKGKKVGHEEVDMEKLNQMKQEKISAWTIWGLIKVIQDSRLSTISNSLEFNFNDDTGTEQKDQKITTTWEAKAAAYRIFKNVARPGRNYIDEEDLLRFMKKEDVDKVLSTFDGVAETRKIKKATLRSWMVKVYKERKLLAHSLDDTKTAIEELNRILSGIILLVIIIVWLHLMGIATTKVLVFISSQLLLAAFIFGNTCKNIFESLIFVFIMHPFDIGDRCVVDGVQMIVEEMNILTTIFLRYDKEMIIYPNSVLATKPISNFFRSPEMGDTVVFAVDVLTPAETIEALKSKIKSYIDRKPKHWFSDHSLQIMEIENVNSLKLGLFVNHTMNFQDFKEKMTRKSELVLELKKIFEELGIKFRLLPQEVHLRNIGSEAQNNSIAML